MVVAPVPSKELVRTGVHCLTGNVTSLLVSNTNWLLTGPFAAVIVSVGPWTEMPVMIGPVNSIPVTSRIWRRLICGSGFGPDENGVRTRVCAPVLSATNRPMMYCPGPLPSDP